MSVDPARAAGHVEHKGTTYFFCSKGCVAKFSADPDKYLSGARESHQTAAAPMLQIGGLKRTSSSPATSRQPPATSHQPPATIYTCPMHPEIRSQKPGACPSAAWRSSL